MTDPASDTPRVDKAAIAPSICVDGVDLVTKQMYKLLADDARQLERELATAITLLTTTEKTATERIAALEAELAEIRKSRDVWKEIAESWNRRTR